MTSFPFGNGGRVGGQISLHCYERMCFGDANRFFLTCNSRLHIVRKSFIMSFHIIAWKGG